MTRIYFVLTALVLLIGSAIALYAQHTDAPPLRMRNGESIWFREARNGLCIRMEIGGSVWVVSDRECREP